MIWISLFRHPLSFTSYTTAFSSYQLCLFITMVVYTIPSMEYEVRRRKIEPIFISATLPSNLFLWWEQIKSNTKYIGFGALLNRNKNNHEVELPCLCYVYSKRLLICAVMLCGFESISTKAREARCRKHFVAFALCSHINKETEWSWDHVFQYAVETADN